MITILAAVSLNNVIGKEGEQLWHISSDLKEFRRLTTNNAVIFGRKTFETIPKELKDRRVIVLTNQKDYESPWASVVHTKEEALKHASTEPEIFIGGGGEIYKLFLHDADEIRITRVHKSFDGDTTFPELSSNEWELIEESPIVLDIDSGLSFSREVYRKTSIIFIQSKAQ